MNSFDYKIAKNLICNCIKKNFNINVDMISVFHLCDEEFLEIIKSNIEKKVFGEYDNREYQISVTKHFLQTPGLYKCSENAVLIKKNEKDDLSLLLAELIHSKSITRSKRYVEDWVREGIPHYLAKVLCEICGIEYSGSAHEEFFVIWERVHRIKGSIEDLLKINFAPYIQMARARLKILFRFEDSVDILTIPFKKAKTLVNLIA